MEEEIRINKVSGGFIVEYCPVRATQKEVCTSTKELKALFEKWIKEVCKFDDPPAGH